MALPIEKLTIYFNLTSNGIECDRTIFQDVADTLNCFRSIISNSAFRFIRFEYSDYYIDIRRINSRYEYKAYIYPITPKIVF